MGIFGKSFEEKVNGALDDIRGQFPGSQIQAQVSGDEVVTLTGGAQDLETKTRIMAAFNAAVETKNTINQIQVEKPPAQAAGASLPPTAGASPASAPGVTAAANEPRIHAVVAGDTLSGIAKKYYGDASKYPRIFDANRDQLNDPDKIKVGQRLKIPT